MSGRQLKVRCRSMTVEMIPNSEYNATTRRWRPDRHSRPCHIDTGDKDLFEFTHLEKAGEKNLIEGLLQGLSEEQIKQSIKLIRAVVN